MRRLVCGPGVLRLSAAAALVFLAVAVQADDWPMWRHDPQRSAVSSEALPSELHLVWVRSYPPLEGAWPDQERLRFDAAYEPVVAARTLFVGSPRSDSVSALDTETGAEKWRFYADGPVRFAPAVWKDRVFLASDDGWLYCLGAADGKLVWKFRGGPSDRKVLGNKRLISMWPARGAPVVSDDTVYFAAGIWPMMGVFVCALDADTGRLLWHNDAAAFTFIPQPHDSPAFAGVAPQGYLAVVGENLLVPNGRAVPACFDRRTGKLRYFHLASNQQLGEFSIMAGDSVFFNDRGLFAVDTGLAGWHRWRNVPDPVLAGDAMYAVVDGRLGAYRVEMKEFAEADGGSHVGPDVTEVWQTGRATRVHLKAGSRLYANDNETVMAVEVPKADGAPYVSWQTRIRGTPNGMIAADGKLFVSTLEGDIACFGTARVAPRAHRTRRPPPGAPDAWTRRAKEILERTGVTEGYCLAFGLESGRLVEELARQSRLHVVAFDADAAKVDRIRRRLDAAGLYGERVALVAGDPLKATLPPCLASLVVSEDLEAGGLGERTRFMEQVLTVLRPYGGVACLAVSPDAHDVFARAMRESFAVETVTRKGDCTLVTREGPLPGAADWTHQYADPSNTVVSKDTRVKLPLGVLWFGGTTHEHILPRHGHGPTPQVVGGRLFIEGPDTLRATDVYTGRLLWEVELPGLGEAYDSTWHQPGANSLGSNYASAPDGVYVAYGEKILRLDPATGKTMSEFTVGVTPGETQKAAFGFLAVYGDLLITGVSPMVFDWDPEFRIADFSRFKTEPKVRKAILDIVNAWKGEPYVRREQVRSDVSYVMRNANELLNEDALVGRIPADVLRKRGATEGARAVREQIDAYLKSRPAKLAYDTTLRTLNRELLQEIYPNFPGKTRGQAGYFNWDCIASRQIVVMDRHTGEELWRREAARSFRHNAICAGGGKVFCIDRLPDGLLRVFQRRGDAVEAAGELLALDARTGKTVWSVSENVFGTWLGYSEKHDVLLESGRPSGDMLVDEPHTMSARRGADGSLLWDGTKYAGGPCMIHGRRIITASDAYDLLTGRPVQWKNPLTGAPEDWEYRRMYGCNSPVACEHLLTFRSAAAGFYDLERLGGTGNFGGFKSGCTSNLIAADGVLSAPDYTRTCTCSYPNQTSLALVHMPEVEVWTFNKFRVGAGPVRRLGLNLGAPGDRRSDDGTLWLEYPTVGGPSPDVSVKTSPDDVEWFYRHSLRLEGAWHESLKWVGASGGEGLAELTVTLERGQAALPWMPLGLETRPYTVRLYFAEVDGVAPGERVFDVALQGRPVLEGLDVAREAGGANRVLVKKFRDVKVRGKLRLTLTPSPSAKRPRTLLCGIEILAEGW